MVQQCCWLPACCRLTRAAEWSPWRGCSGRCLLLLLLTTTQAAGDEEEQAKGRRRRPCCCCPARTEWCASIRINTPHEWIRAKNSPPWHNAG